jgi:hypothetical protein
MKEQEHPLSRLGWSAYCAESPAFDIPVGQIPARVIEEQKRYYFADNGTEVLLCRPSGKLRHNAVDRTAMPVVGDFVLVTRQQSQKTATIESILQRRTVLSRKDPGGDVEQILCRNVNLASMPIPTSVVSKGSWHFAGPVASRPSSCSTRRIACRRPKRAQRRLRV